MFHNGSYWFCQLLTFFAAAAAVAAVEIHGNTSKELGLLFQSSRFGCVERNRALEKLNGQGDSFCDFCFSYSKQSAFMENWSYCYSPVPWHASE